MFFPLYLSTFFIYSVCSIQLALIKLEPERNLSLLFDSSSSKAFCFPNDMAVRSFADDTNHHNWGYSSSWNFSIAMQRVGQVFCRQLGFSNFKSIMPIEGEENRSSISWVASCLGYEPDISHCLFEQFIDHGSICKRFVGLSCHHCNKYIYSLHTSETLMITNPGFPKLYNDDAICEWLITTNISLPFVIKIQHLWLPKRDNFGSCSNGFLEIRSKNKDLEPYSSHKTLCGKTVDMILIVEGSILSLRLVSGIFHPRPHGSPGFNLSVSLLDDLTIGGNIAHPTKSPLTSEEIVGIVFGSLAILILLVPLAMLAKYLCLRKRRQRQRLANTLQVKIGSETPCVGFTVKKAPLPAIPRNKEGSTLSPSSEESIKYSLESGIYENVNLRCSSSYLQFDDVRKKLSMEDEANNNTSNKVELGLTKEDERLPMKEANNKPNYNFCVPEIMFTSYEEGSPTKGNSENSRSQPSDMPSCLSFGSDSVFSENGNFESPDLRSTMRNGTYTIVSEIKRNATYILEKGPKERHNSSPINFWSKIRKEFLELHYVGQRRSSEPIIKSDADSKNRG